MTNKVFTDYVTPIDAAWLNDVNGATYLGTGVNTPAGGVTATTQQAAINELDTKKAPLASPALTGTPTAPTATPGTNTTQVATTAYVTAADVAIQNGIPTTVATAVHAAASKTTPVDADELYVLDSSSTFSLAKLTWANLKATLVTYLSALTTTWAISTTGNAATATTIAGTSVPKLPTIGCTQATGALTFSSATPYLDFRSTTLTSGVITTISAVPSNLVLPSGGTLGAVSTITTRIVVVEINNAGTRELACVNLAGGNDLSETGTINTTAISAASTANNVFYSTTARTGVAYRVVGVVDAVNTAGAWGNPTLVQGAGGQAVTAMSSLGYGQTYIDQTASRALATTYYNTSGKPRFVSISFSSTGNSSGSVTVNGTIVARVVQGYTAGAVVVTFFIVQAGASYSVAQDSASLTITKWFELS